jgi:hypothetical protein
MEEYGAVGGMVDGEKDPGCSISTAKYLQNKDG